MWSSDKCIVDMEPLEPFTFHCRLGVLWVIEEEGRSSETPGGGDDAAGVLEHGVPLPPPIKTQKTIQTVTAGFTTDSDLYNSVVDVCFCYLFLFHNTKSENRKQPFTNKYKNMCTEKGNSFMQANSLHPGS